jgi:hypothetical protein
VERLVDTACLINASVDAGVDAKTLGGEGACLVDYGGEADGGLDHVRGEDVANREKNAGRTGICGMKR